ncbi:MAG: hypothetical protein J6Z03_08870 [Erysipelotrichaceae bacterium]|nr:hypothetical protein [Erysipelotrichaceae bacterium]
MKKKKNGFLKIVLFIVLVLVVVGVVRALLPKNHEIDNVITNDTDEGKNSFAGMSNAYSSSYSANWKLNSNVGVLDLNVADGVRGKRTQILGNGRDIYTIMVYMCGADLESEYGMAVNDLVEMARATASDKVNVIVFTGGSKRWNTDVISSKYNQIIKISGNGQISYLVENAGTGTMLDADNMTSFIEYCADNFPANRYGLILWDHGGGSISGYGYDEKYPNTNPMTLADIDRTLTDADVTFDFVGFDACLMATTETAIMLAEHADYLIGSEESEPGIGWYYTDWLSRLAANTSMPTVEIGKNIADDFVNHCRRETPGQSATLSVVDLAEIQDIVPTKLSAFSLTTEQMISNDFYTVAAARKGSREFASDTYIDMVDIVDMASKIDTPEALDLTRSLMSAIKYNNTTSDMSNAYGLSVYFPYRSTRYVNMALDVYDKIDMDQNYASCVRSFASYAGAGQVAGGGYSNAYNSFNGYDNSYYSDMSSEEFLYDLLEQFMMGAYSTDSSYDSYYDYDFDSWFNRAKTREIASYLSKNHFNSDLNWKDGKITLSADQWKLVDTLRLNVFVDDGEGYVELGKDAIYTIDDNGSLLKPEDMTWLAASIDNENWQLIPYYHLYQTEYENGIVYSGRIPVLFNGNYANLITSFTDDKLEVVGVCLDYLGERDVVAKNMVRNENGEQVDFASDSEYKVDVNLKAGDEIEFICDYFDYDGNFESTHVLGDKIIIKDQLYLGDVDISEYDTLASYEFKDIYQECYYSQALR